MDKQQAIELMNSLIESTDEEDTETIEGYILAAEALALSIQLDKVKASA